MRRFLRQAPSKRPASAETLGGQAALLGLETLFVSSIHVQALQRVALPEDAPGAIRPEVIEQAEIFFKETIAPIEATHRAARKAEARIDLLNSALRRRTGELSESLDRLTQAIIRRKAAEARILERGKQHDQCLKEAKRMQNGLRDRMRAMLVRQEGERKRIGNALRDEIAQALIAIDIGLLALNTAGPDNDGKIEKSIADAQRILQTELKIRTSRTGLISL